MSTRRPIRAHRNRRLLAAGQTRSQLDANVINARMEGGQFIFGFDQRFIGIPQIFTSTIYWAGEGQVSETVQQATPIGSEWFVEPNKPNAEATTFSIFVNPQPNTPFTTEVRTTSGGRIIAKLCGTFAYPII